MGLSNSRYLSTNGSKPLAQKLNPCLKLAEQTDTFAICIPFCTEQTAEGFLSHGCPRQRISCSPLYQGWVPVELWNSSTECNMW